MLAEWLVDWSDTYLHELYAHHRPPNSTRKCSCGQPDPPSFRCTDCLTHETMCKECLVSSHRALPAHRVQEWLGAAWSKTTLKKLGLSFALGDHGTPCNKGSSKDFVLGDTTGLHLISVTFCGCRHSAEPSMQLLRRRIFPCSDDEPATGFTFSALRQFHLASVDAKLSGSRYFSILQRSTNNLMPHENVNRFREFVRAARAWMFLQDHKRAGTFSISAERGLSLALRCPACPRLNVNYVDRDVSEGEV